MVFKKGDRERKNAFTSASPSQVEVEAFKNPTELFQLINFGRWEKVVKRLIFYPDEANVWIVNKNETDGKTKWRYLPLHMVCLQSNPPSSVVKALIDAYPNGARCRDNDSNLPLHYLCAEGSNDPKVLECLIDAYPGSLQQTDKYGRNGLDIIQQTESSKFDPDTRKLMTDVMQWRLGQQSKNMEVRHSESRDEAVTKDATPPRKNHRPLQKAPISETRITNDHKILQKPKAQNTTRSSAFRKFNASRPIDSGERDKASKKKLENELENQHQVIEELQSKINALDKGHWKDQSTIVNLETKLKSKVDNETQGEAKFKELTSNLENAVHENGNLKKKVAELSVDSSGVQKKMHSQLEEIEALKAASLEDKNEIESLKAEVNLRKQSSDDEGQREKLIMTKYENTIANLKGSSAMMGRKMKEMHRRDSAERQRISSRVQELETMLSKSKDKVSVLNRKIIHIEEENEEYSCKMEEKKILVKEAKALREKVNLLTTEVRNTERIRNDSDKKYHGLQNTSSTTISELEEKLAEATKKKTYAEKKQLECNVEQSHQISELECQVESSKIEISSLKSKVRIISEEKDMYQIEAQTANTRKSKEMHNFNQEILTLGEKNKRLTDGNREMAKKLDEQGYEFDAKIKAVEAAVNMQASAFANLQQTQSDVNDDTTHPSTIMAKESFLFPSPDETERVHILLCEKNELSLKLQEQAYENQSLQKRMQFLVEENSLHMAKIDECHLKLKEYYAQEDCLGDAKRKNDIYEAKLKDLTTQKIGLESEKNNLEGQVNMMEDKLKEAQEMLSEQTSQEKVEKDKSLEEMSKLDSSQKRNQELRDIIAKNNSSYHAQAEHMKKKHISLSQENTLLRAKMKSIHELHIEKVSTLEEMEKEKLSAEQTFDEIHNENSELSRSVRTLQEENSKLKGHLEEMQKLESLYKELEGKSASLEELSNNLMKQNNLYEDQIRELNVRLEEQNEYETQVDTNELRMKGLFNGSKDSSIELMIIKAQNEELREKLKIVIAEANAKSDVVKEHEGASESYWEQRARELQSLANDLMRKNNENEAHVKGVQMQGSNSQLIAQASALRRKNSEYEIQVKELMVKQMYLEKSESQISANVDMGREIENLRIRNKELHESIQELKNKCLSYQKKIQLLTVNKSAGQKAIADELSAKVATLASSLVSISSLQNKLVQTSMKHENDTFARAAEEREKLVQTILRQEEEIEIAAKERNQLIQALDKHREEQKVAAVTERERILMEARNHDEYTLSESGADRENILKAVYKLQEEIEEATADISFI